MREVTPDLLLAAYRGRESRGEYSAVSVNGEKLSAPLPSIATWRKWQQRITEVWEYCREHGWVGKDLHLKLASL
ncbi:hypothetical protein RQN30_05075 [Arcanobacterium hippocoleae]